MGLLKYIKCKNGTKHIYDVSNKVLGSDCIKVELTENSIINIISVMGFIICIIAFILKGSLTPEYVLPLFLTYLLPSPIGEKLKGATISKNTKATPVSGSESTESIIELDGGYEEDA